MTLTALDTSPIFSLTVWKNDDGYVCSVQTHAGAAWRTATRGKVSEAVGAVLRTKAGAGVAAVLRTKAGAQPQIPPCPVPPCPVPAR